MHTAVGAGVNLAVVNYITPAEVGATAPGAIYITVTVWIMVTVVLQCTMLVLALPLLLLPIGKSPALSALHVSGSVSAAVAALRARAAASEPRRAIGWREATRAVVEAAGCVARPRRPGDIAEPDVVRWERRVAAKDFFLHANQVRLRLLRLLVPSDWHTLCSLRRMCVCLLVTVFCANSRILLLPLTC